MKIILLLSSIFISTVCYSDIGECINDTFIKMDGGYIFGVTKDQAKIICEKNIQDCTVSLYINLDGKYSYGITPSQSIKACTINKSCKAS